MEQLIRLSILSLEHLFPIFTYHQLIITRCVCLFALQTIPYPLLCIIFLHIHRIHQNFIPLSVCLSCFSANMSQYIGGRFWLRLVNVLEVKSNGFYANPLCDNISMILMSLLIISYFTVKLTLWWKLNDRNQFSPQFDINNLSYDKKFKSITKVTSNIIFIYQYFRWYSLT